MAPSEAGMAIIISRFSANIGSVNNGNLFKAIRTKKTTNNVMKYARKILMI
jgi:hypothetical protein